MFCVNDNDEFDSARFAVLPKARWLSLQSASAPTSGPTATHRAFFL